MGRIVRPPAEAPLRFPSGACHGARPEDPVRCPPVPPASGASRSRGRRRGRTFEAAEPEGLQPCESRDSCSRARGSGTPGAGTTANPRRPIGQPPATLELGCVPGRIASARNDQASSVQRTEARRTHRRRRRADLAVCKLRRAPCPRQPVPGSQAVGIGKLRQQRRPTRRGSCERSRSRLGV